MYFKDIKEFSEYMNGEYTIHNPSDIKCEFYINGIERTIHYVWGFYYSINLGIGSLKTWDDVITFLNREYPIIFRKIKIEKLLKYER